MTIEASMENSNGSIVDYSSEIETLNNKKVKKVVADGYSSMEEDIDCKVEVVESVYAMSSERSDDEWIKPKNEKPKVETPDKKHICGRLSVVAIHSPGRHQNGSDGGASSSEASPGGSSPSRSCTQCGATKTPLWRNGPSGPKSLCNACGIRYKKVGGTKRTTGTNEPGHESSCGKSKSPKRKAEADPPSETRNVAHSHRRSKIQARDKREVNDDNNNVNNSSNKSHEASSSKDQKNPAVASNIPRRVCTRRTTFYTPKWGARSARLRKSEAKDEEEQEGAALLMALACGMVNA